MRRIGFQGELKLKRAGFYPRGGGEIISSIQPIKVIMPLVIKGRGNLVNYPVAEPRGIFKNQKLTAYCHDTLIYRLITSAVTSSPTLLTKYPSLQNSPPQSSSLTSGNSLNITLALLLFNILTISPGEYLGGAPRNICT